MIFVAQQVPALTMTSSDMFPLVDTLVHTEKNTPDLLDSKSILHAAEFLVGILDGCNMMGQTIPPTLRSKSGFVFEVGKQALIELIKPAIYYPCVNAPSTSQSNTSSAMS